MSSANQNVFRLVSHMLAAVFNNPSAFHREWNTYRSAVAEDAVVGRWTGEWISDTSGHRGELKCLLSPAGAGLYRAFFYARYSKLFRVGYTTEMKVERTGGKTLLHGEEDLGALAGGKYRCEGELQEAELTCHYSCKYDQGSFRLKRLD